jgi:hypothetical protein
MMFVTRHATVRRKLYAWLVAVTFTTVPMLQNNLDDLDAVEAKYDTLYRCICCDLTTFSAFRNVLRDNILIREIL